MLNVVYLDSCLFPENFSLRKLNFEHNWKIYRTTKPEQVFERCKDADIILTCKVIFDRTLIKQLAERGRLKLIQVTFTGTNNIDHEACKEYGITIQNVSEYSTNSVAEHVIGEIIALARGFYGWNRDQILALWAKQTEFTYQDYPIYDVEGKTLTIVGRGSIGNVIATKAKALGMRILFAEHKDADTLRENYTEFYSAVRQADFITLNCPLTSQTSKMVDAEFIKNMKKTAFLINTGRGGLIDEFVLDQALREGQIAGAALDVLSIEPPTMNNPLVRAAIELPNLHITPHIGFASQQSLRNLSEWMLQRVETFVHLNYPEVKVGGMEKEEDPLIDTNE